MSKLLHRFLIFLKYLNIFKIFLNIRSPKMNVKAFAQVFNGIDDNSEDLMMIEQSI